LQAHWPELLPQEDPEVKRVEAEAGSKESEVKKKK
jgi:hypothetical protein